MNQRFLRADEKPQVLEALLESKIASKELCRYAVDSTIIIPTSSSFLPPLTEGLRPFIAYLALRNRATAIALGQRVYIRRHLFDQSGTLPIFLVAHEAAHVVQFKRDGVGPFLARYLTEYLIGRLQGMSDRESYLAISYEREARAVETCLSVESQR